MSRFGVEVVLHWTAVAFYVASALLFASAVIFGQERRQRWAWPLGALGLVPHGAALAIRWVASGHGPYMLKYEVLSSNAWVALVFVLAFTLRRPKWGVLALVVLPVAIVTIALALFSNPDLRELPPSLRSIWLVFHIGFAKVSAGSFLLSLASAVALLLKDRPSPAPWLQRVPTVEALDAYVGRFAGYGFLFWTVTIAAGSIWANESWGRYWGWDVIETWSLIAWLVYGTLLHARRFFRLRPRAGAWASIACFAVFILTLAILPLVWPTIHTAYFQ